MTNLRDQNPTGQSKTPASSESPPSMRPQVTVAQMMAAVTLFCVLFGAYYWVGPVYATIALVPVAIAIPLWLIQPNTLLGALIGMLLMWLLADYLIIGWSKLAWQYYACQFSLGMYAAAFGSGLHGIYLGRWLSGGITATASGLAFVSMMIFQGVLPPT